MILKYAGNCKRNQTVSFTLRNIRSNRIILFSHFVIILMMTEINEILLVYPYDPPFSIQHNRISRSEVLFKKNSSVKLCQIYGKATVLESLFDIVPSCEPTT